MNLHLVFTCAAVCLLACTPLRAVDFATNTPAHSCCQILEPAARVLPEKSLYQLDAAWTNDSGQAIRLGDLRGRPQVVVLFFAQCRSTCPLLVYQMKQLEAELPAGVRARVGFTLVSFDSTRDTPEVLKQYRQQHELSRANWTLLHGGADQVQDLAALLGLRFKETAPGQFSHSNLITLLNADGEIVYQQAGLSSDSQAFVKQIEQLNRAAP